MMEHSPLSPTHLPRKQEQLLAVSYHRRRPWGQGQLLLEQRWSPSVSLFPTQQAEEWGRGQ